MSDLLSYEDYQALAAELTLPRASHIDGGYHACSGDNLKIE